MINDLPPKLLQNKNINCALFADDLVLWTSTENKDEAKLSREMNKALDELSKWCEENLMTINPAKSYFQVFTLKHKDPQIQISLENTPIQETNEAKYLGIYLDKKLTWKTHAEKISESAQKRLKLLKRLTATKWGCSRSTLNQTYKSYIKPVLQYGSEVLVTSPNHASKLEKVQNQALRIITGGVKTTPILAMQILTNNRPIQYDIEEKGILLYEKLRRLPTKIFGIAT